MRPLTYSRAADVEEALALASAHPASAFLAGGTTEVDLIRAGVSGSAAASSSASSTSAARL